MFYYNYVDLCNKVNKSPSAVAEEMGLKRSVVTAWKNGRVPRQATAQKVASYFGVSVDYLISNKKIPATGNGNGVADADLEKDEAIKLYQDAPQWLRDQILGLLKAEVSSREDSGKDPKER